MGIRIHYNAVSTNNRVQIVLGAEGTEKISLRGEGEVASFKDFLIIILSEIIE